MALTVQDPYTLTPNERSRYESLFPQYANDDGFMYGKEAVQLFSKSGLGQALLRDIWNIADQPVDNRLDKLEFAIAMHLIVCVSKKNLPMPKVLPISLKALKQNQQQQLQQQQQMQAQMQMQAHNEEELNAPAPSGVQGAPPYNTHPQMPGQQAHPGESNMAGLSSGMSLSGMPGPPLISKPGGLGISDAFEGLNSTENMSSLPPPANGFGSLGGYGGGIGNEPSYGGTGMTTPMEQQSPRMDSAPPPMPSPPNVPHASKSQPLAMSMRSTAPEAPPKSSEVLAQSYNMSDNTGELDKMKVVLQKLQAENIALRAQLGTMSEDEKDVQRQLNATVVEIGVLSSRLTTLRAQVLASKASLMEVTAELKSAQEKKGYVYR
jgi:Cytoskeletal-regulatory complex EF hand